MTDNYNTLDPLRLAAVNERERSRYAAARPQSQALAERAAAHLMFGVLALTADQLLRLVTG